MGKFQSDTEKKILLAANRTFVKKGFDATRMDEIAQIAGVNKSAVHYYFRSKKKLFEKIFENELLKLGSELYRIAGLDFHSPNEIKESVSKYIDFLFENPLITLFILNEVNNNPGKEFGFNGEIGGKHYLSGKTTTKQPDEEFKRISLTVNLLSLCTFPFICGPFICKVLFNSNTADYNSFLYLRKKEVSNMIIQSLINNK